MATEIPEDPLVNGIIIAQKKPPLAAPLTPCGKGTNVLQLEAALSVSHHLTGTPLS